MNPTLFPDNKNNTTKEKEAKRILLIDDNESTNFFNKVVIERNMFAEVTIAINGQKALNHIKSLLEENLNLPEFILLDINMPVMNGWEFLEAFTQLTPSYGNSKIIISSTADFNESHKEHVEKLNISNFAFVEKMMSKKVIKQFML